jgi:hypothetical protein
VNFYFINTFSGSVGCHLLCLKHFILFELLFYKHKNIPDSLLRQTSSKGSPICHGVAFRISFIICQIQCKQCCHVADITCTNAA